MAYDNPLYRGDCHIRREDKHRHGHREIIYRISFVRFGEMVAAAGIKAHCLVFRDLRSATRIYSLVNRSNESRNDILTYLSSHLKLENRVAWIDILDRARFAIKSIRYQGEGRNGCTDRSFHRYSPADLTCFFPHRSLF